MIIKSLLIIFLNVFLSMAQTEDTISKKTLADFTDEKTRLEWGVVNDDVMGGVSTSRISVSENNTLLFTGNVSLENNGGFASLRSPLNDYDLSNYEGFLIKLKGDGKDYSLSFRQTNYFTGYNYNLRFKTEESVWQVIKLPFKDFKLKYYGKEVNDTPNADTKEIKQISLLISDKQQGPFKIEIEWIGLY